VNAETINTTGRTDDMAVTKVKYEDRQVGDLIVVKASAGWSVPAGWTRLSKTGDPYTYAYRIVAPDYSDVRGVGVVSVYRGVRPWQDVTIINTYRED
jgi:hypothetical protein